MEFTITSKDISNANERFQENWTEKLININSRPFKKSFNYVEYEKFKIHWIINKYVGQAPDRSFTFFSQQTKENDYVIPEISLMTVLNHINNLTNFDNEYSPEEGDELKIYRDYYYKEIKELKRPYLDFHTISLIYKNNEWIKGNYTFDIDETKFYLRGIIKL